MPMNWCLLREAVKQPIHPPTQLWISPTNHQTPLNLWPKLALALPPIKTLLLCADAIPTKAVHLCEASKAWTHTD